MHSNAYDKIASLRIAISTHIATSGPGQELEKYLQGNCLKLVFIGHPFYNSTLKSTFYRIHETNRKSRILRSHIPRVNPPFNFVFDLLKTIFFFILRREKYDLFIGIDNLNALSGLLLKKFGLVNSVVFYVIDYVPKRFDNNVLNKLYHWLDRYCSTHCNAVWNLSDRMIEERAKVGISISDNLQQVVPMGADFKNIVRMPIEKVDRRCLVYLGGLMEKQGVQLLIEAMPILLKKFPDLKLIIIGKGPLRGKLEELCRQYNIVNSVDFKGEVSEQKDVENILTKCAIGIALYKPDPQNYSQFTDVGKPKVYAACGLPIVITRVPPISKVIEKLDAGYVIDYDKTVLIDVLVEMFQNDEIYQKKRNNAIDFAANYSWESIFNRAFHELFESHQI